MIVYMYGMKYRGFSIGCQPKDGFAGRKDDEKKKYHDIIFYDRKLSLKEEEEYELEYLGREVI